MLGLMLGAGPQAVGRSYRVVGCHRTTYNHFFRLCLVPYFSVFLVSRHCLGALREPPVGAQVTHLVLLGYLGLLEVIPNHSRSLQGQRGPNGRKNPQKRQFSLKLGSLYRS